MASQENPQSQPARGTWRPLAGDTFDFLDLLRFGTFLKLYRQNGQPVRPGEINFALLAQDPKMPAHASATLARLQKARIVAVVDTAPLSVGSTLTVKRYAPLFDSADQSSLTPLLAGKSKQVEALRGLVSVEANLLKMESEARELTGKLETARAEKAQLHQRLVALNHSDGALAESMPAEPSEIDVVLHQLSERIHTTRAGVEKLREKLLGSLDEEVSPEEVTRYEQSFAELRMTLKYGQLDLEATQREIKYFRRLIDRSNNGPL